MSRLAYAPKPSVKRHVHPVLHATGRAPDGPADGPSPTQLAALSVASRVIVSVDGLPDLPTSRRAVALLYCDIADEANLQRQRDGGRRTDTRVPTYAASWAHHYERQWKPVGANLAVDAARRACDALDGPGRALQAIGRRQLPAQEVRPLARLVWQRAGHTIIDDLSAADLPEAVLSQHARARVAAHLRLGMHLSGFDGVRVVAPRVPLASVHVPAQQPPNGELRHHVLGQCDACQRWSSS